MGFIRECMRKIGMGERDSKRIEDRVKEKFAQDPFTTRKKAQEAAIDELLMENEAARQSIFSQLPKSLLGDLVPPESKLDNLRRKYQDQHLDTRKVIDAIEKQEGKLPDVLNPTYYIDTYSGKQDAKTQEFEKQELEPLKEQMTKQNVSVEQLNDYLLAMTAKDANAKFAAMNPPKQQSDLFDADWDNSALSGMSNADAQAILDAADHAVMKPLADQVFAMLKETRKLMVAYGEESQETIDQWEQENPLYIPRRREGFQDEEHELGRTQGLAVAGHTTKTALGSQRKVVDVLGHITSHRLKVIARGERGVPILTLAALFMKYPHKDFVRITKPLSVSYVDPATGLTETIAQPHEAGPMKRVFDKKTGTVKWVHDGHNFYADHVVPFKVQGVQYGLVFNRDNPRAKAMARGLKGTDVKVLSGLMGTIATGTRTIASLNTQYSPAFGPWNAMRDLLFATATLENGPLKGQQRSIVKQAVKNIASIYKEARAARDGKVSDSGFANRYKRFQDAGGMTGWRNLYMTGEEQAQDIEKMLHPSAFRKSWAGKGGQALVDWVQDYNASFENGTRLAVFEAALKQGLPEVRAASMAKDVTVNFNRRGTVSTQVGALYAFFNVTMQSSERIITTLFEKGSYGKLSDAGKKIVMGGMTAGAMQAAGLAMMGFKDDEPPEFVKARSFVIPAPFTEKGYIAIPMALGFNILPNAGRLAMEALIYGEPEKRAWDFTLAVTSAIDPVGFSGSLLQGIAPTVLDPVASLYENKDWTGRSIYRPDFMANKPTPGHSRANQDAGDWAMFMSRAVNWAFGGTEYTPGYLGDMTISPTPEAFEYLLGFFAGGPGRETAKIGKLLSAARQDEPIELYNIPLLGKMVGTAAGKNQEWGRWREHMQTMHRHKLELEGRKGDAKAMREYRQAHPLASKVGYAKHTESLVRKLLGRRRDLMAKDETKLTKLEKARVDKRIQETVQKFNERIAAASQ